MIDNSRWYADLISLFDQNYVEEVAIDGLKDSLKTITDKYVTDINSKLSEIKTTTTSIIEKNRNAIKGEAGKAVLDKLTKINDSIKV